MPEPRSRAKSGPTRDHGSKRARAGEGLATSPRPFWSGTIGFGLVAVPVDLYPATRSAVDVSLRMLAPDGAPLRREYVCPKHGRALERDEIVRAFERDGGELVVLTDEELEGLAPEASRNIEILQFVAREQLSPMLFERPYFLLPSSSATKPYRLLARVLEDSGRAGVASFVMRGRQHMVAILAEEGLLRAQTLRFASELRTPEQLGLPAEPEQLDAAAIKRLRRLIRAEVEADLDPEELEDEVRVRTFALAERKLAEGRDVIEQPSPEPGAEAEIIDLMEVLRQSLGRPPTSPASPAPRSLADASKQELYAEAQALDIEGRSSMTKDELRVAIERAR